jgi:hypothetical protein
MKTKTAAAEPMMALFQDRHRRRQRAGPQDDGQVARLVDGELAGDHGAPARDPLVDARCRVQVAVEDDGQVLADVGLGHLAEDPGAGGGELDGHLPVARRVRIGLHLRPRELGARQQRAFLHDVRHLALDLGLLVGAALVQDLRPFGQPAGQRLLG